MENNNNQKEIIGMVERALDDFRQGMEYREKLSIRIGRRTTQIIRFGMADLSGNNIGGLQVFPSEGPVKYYQRTGNF